MKIIYRKIEPYENPNFSENLRDTKSYVNVLLKIMRKLLDNYSVFSPKEKSSTYDIPYIKLVIDKQSRVFVYVSAEKFYSLNFPFQVEVEHKTNKVLSIYTKEGILCDNVSISIALSLLEDIKANSLIDVYESIESEDKIKIEAYKILEYFWQIEPAYLRFDHDSKHVKGLLHPLNHLDINLTSNGEYKLGLAEKILPSTFEDIIDAKSDCYFLLKKKNEVNTLLPYYKKPKKRKNKKKRKK